MYAAVAVCDLCQAVLEEFNGLGIGVVAACWRLFVVAGRFGFVSSFGYLVAAPGEEALDAFLLGWVYVLDGEVVAAVAVDHGHQRDGGSLCRRLSGCRLGVLHLVKHFVVGDKNRAAAVFAALQDDYHHEGALSYEKATA